MSDLQIKIVSNGWIVTDRYGTQFVYTDPLDFINAVAIKTMSIEERNTFSLRVADDE